MEAKTIGDGREHLVIADINRIPTGGLKVTIYDRLGTSRYHYGNTYKIVAAARRLAKKALPGARTAPLIFQKTHKSGIIQYTFAVRG